MEGTGLVGWILATVAFAGIYGAVTNKPWLSVLAHSVNPKANVKSTIDSPSNSGGVTGSGVGGSGGTSSASGSAATVIDYARTQLGKPYEWAGAGPNSYDCSGLTMRAYDTVGVHLAHNSAIQLTQTALHRIPLVPVPPAGALCFYGTPPHHVGISLGDGTMISAPHTGTVVRIDNIVGFGSDLSAMTTPLENPYTKATQVGAL